MTAQNDGFEATTRGACWHAVSGERGAEVGGATPQGQAREGCCLSQGRCYIDRSVSLSCAEDIWITIPVPAKGVLSRQPALHFFAYALISNRVIEKCSWNMAEHKYAELT